MSEVAVIVPLYNKERYVARALESILAQTFADFEVVIVDDGSTDRSAEVASLFVARDARVRLLTQTNSGPGSARNAGLKETTAPLVAFLDADDEWLPEFLQKSLENLRAHPECALSAMGQYRYANKADWQYIFEQNGIKEGQWSMPDLMDPKDLKSNLDFMHCGAILCRREAIVASGGFYDKDRCLWNEDVYLWFQILLNHSIYRDPKSIMWYHTEASQLYTWPIGPTQLPPMLIDPQPIRQSCPSKHRAFLERALAHFAVLHANYQIECRNFKSAWQFLSKFPRGAILSFSYWRTAARLAKQMLLSQSASMPTQQQDEPIGAETGKFFLSVAMITKNAARQLPRTLGAIHGIANEIVVVDCGSEDDTTTIAKTFGAKVLHRAWTGYADQKNYAIEMTSGDWILSLDADEEVSPDLAGEILGVLSRSVPANVAGFSIARQFIVDGKPIRYGGFYPDRQKRLFRKGAGHFKQRLVHESLVLTGDLRELRTPLNHYSFESLSQYEAKLNKYAELSAQHHFENDFQPWRSKRLNEFTHTVYEFLRRYFWLRGFVGGKTGLQLCIIYSGYVRKQFEYTRKLLQDNRLSAQTAQPPTKTLDG